MTYYWIRKEDLQNQEVIDEAEISHGDIFVKVTDPMGAIAYSTETTPTQRKEKQEPIMAF